MSKPLHPIVTIAISGPSSSGKSTLSHLLSLLLPAPITTPIIHADDFYRPDSQLPLKPLPTTTEPVLDWDCPEALNFPAFISTLQHVKQHGVLPDAHKTYEDPSIAEKGVERVVGSGVVRELKEKYKGEIERFKETGGRVVMVDGFLLFGEGVPKELGVEFDVKLLLRASYEKAKYRRENRGGYETQEDHWTDPSGYFEHLVWPAYIDQHKHLFVGDNVTAGLLTEEARKDNLVTQPDIDMTLEDSMKWAVDIVMNNLTKS